jgi:hypothetical protein
VLQLYIYAYFVLQFIAHTYSYPQFTITKGCQRNMAKETAKNFRSKRAIGEDFMFCGSCGKEWPDGTMFCGSCGAKMAVSATRSDLSGVRKKRTNTGVGAVLAIIVIAGLIVAIVGIQDQMRKAKDRAEIETLVDTFIDSMEILDIDSMKDCYAPQIAEDINSIMDLASIIPGGNIVAGMLLDGSVGSFLKNNGNEILRFDITDHDIELTDKESATANVDFLASGFDGTDGSGAYKFWLTKIDGSWYIEKDKLSFK